MQHENKHYAQLINIWDADRIRDNSSPGVGKSSQTAACVCGDLLSHPDHHWVIIAPEHKLIDGSHNLLENYDGVHIWGKNHFEHFSPECYIHGCTKCPFKEECGYLQQEWSAHILIMPYEMLQTVAHMTGEFDYIRSTFHLTGWWGLVIEEDPFRLWMRELPLTPELLQYCECMNTRTIIYMGGQYQIQDVRIRLDAVQTYAEWQLYQMQYCDTLYLHSFHNQTTLFGTKMINLRSYDKVIFNCATTPRELESLYFGHQFSACISVGTDLTNPIIQIGSRWGLYNTQKREEDVMSFLCKIRPVGKMMVVTKKFAEKDFEALSDTVVVHYGSARGMNTFEDDYALVVIYGAYHYDPLTKVKMMVCGITEALIGQMEDAEVIQALHRFRPINRPDIPIILMSNHIYDSAIWTTVPATIIDVVNYPEKMEEYSQSQYYTFQTFFEWQRRFIFKEKSKHECVVDYRRTHTVKDTAAFFEISESTVKRLWKRSYTALNRDE